MHSCIHAHMHACTPAYISMLCSLVLTVSLVFGQLGLKATCKTTGPDSMSRQAGGTAAARLAAASVLAG